MKQAFALIGLLGAASCSSPSAPAAATSPAASNVAPGQPTTAAVQQAVTAYIKSNAPSFVGYEPVRWGQPIAYTKLSEAAIKGVVAMQLFDNALALRSKALVAYKVSLARREVPAKTAVLKARYNKASQYNDSLLALANSFGAVKDTTRLGTQIGHAYRLRTKSGAMRLDSATFVVYATGQVEQL